MAIRYIKILLVVLVGLQGLFYAFGNIVNWDAAVGFVASVLAMDGHEVYPAALAPAITSPALIWLALAVIVAGELAVGLLAAKGAYDLWVARAAPTDVFQAAATCGILACAMAMTVWFGFFMVLGAAWFQMWQTPLGLASLNGSFQYAIVSGLVLLFLNQPER